MQLIELPKQDVSGSKSYGEEPQLTSAASDEIYIYVLGLHIKCQLSKMETVKPDTLLQFLKVKSN